MNKNIFVELTCASTIQNVLVEKRDGVTWLRSSIDVDTPSPRPLCVNVLVKIDDLISDFFELATLIEKNIDLSKYVPMYYDDFMCFISERIKMTVSIISFTVRFLINGVFSYKKTLN